MGSDLDNGYEPWMDAPKWPDFVLYKDSSGRWEAATDTGRPKTPIFTVWMNAHADLPESLIRAEARHTLDEAYARAHPNGCPGSH
jgi:hypothetical protein